MQLPVVPSSSVVSEATLVRLYDRALLHWLRHYGDENDIEVGVAIVNAELAHVPEASTLLDAIVPARRQCPGSPCPDRRRVQQDGDDLRPHRGKPGFSRRSACRAV